CGARLLELAFFAPEQLPAWFPGLQEPTAALRLLHHDVPADQLLAATRPPGAELPPGEAPDADDLLDLGADHEPVPEPPPPTPADLSAYGRALLRRAERAAARGNDVRALICRPQVLDLGAAHAHQAGAALPARLDPPAARPA